MTVKSSSKTSVLYAMIPQQRIYQLPQNIAGVKLTIQRGHDGVSVVKSASSVILSSRVILPGAPIAGKTSAFRVCLTSFAHKFQKPPVPTSIPSTSSNARPVNTPSYFAQQMEITAGKATTSLLLFFLKVINDNVDTVNCIGGKLSTELCLLNGRLIDLLKQKGCHQEPSPRSDSGSHQALFTKINDCDYVIEGLREYVFSLCCAVFDRIQHTVQHLGIL